MRIYFTEFSNRNKYKLLYINFKFGAEREQKAMNSFVSLLTTV